MRNEMRQQRIAGVHDVRRILFAGQKAEKRLGQRVSETTISIENVRVEYIPLGTIGRTRWKAV